MTRRKRSHGLPTISAVAFSPARTEDVDAGLLGFVCCTIGDLRLDGITVRRTAAGALTLVYPGRTDGAGDRHPYVRPIEEQARREIERQILDAVGYLRKVAP